MQVGGAEEGIHLAGGQPSDRVPGEELSCLPGFGLSRRTPRASPLGRLAPGNILPARPTPALAPVLWYVEQRPTQPHTVIKGGMGVEEKVTDELPADELPLANIETDSTDDHVHPVVPCPSRFRCRLATIRPELELEKCLELDALLGC
jgi:hypothetical protein